MGKVQIELPLPFPELSGGSAPASHPDGQRVSILSAARLSGMGAGGMVGVL